MEQQIFIGRKQELKELQKAFKNTENGNGQLVLIEGDAGIGKSGLVQEFVKQLNIHQTVKFAITECNDKEDLNPYAPFKDVLIQLNSFTGDLSSQEKRKDSLKKLRNFISEAGTGWLELIPVVGNFASASVDTFKAFKKVYQQTPEQGIESEKDIYRIFENELRRLASGKPIIIFIDDLQWADASSLNLIFALGKSIRANPFKILLIGSYRSDEIKAGRNKISENGELVKIRHPFADKLGELQNYTKREAHLSSNNNWFVELKMKPFDSKEIIDLINLKFNNNQFTDSFYNKIIDITDGHPLFLVEILDYLKHNQFIYQDEKYYKAKEFNIKDLPVSVNAVISEKVERLNKDLKKVLEYASVNGEEFAVQVIERLLKIDELDLLDYLEELSQKYGLLVAGEPVMVKDMLFDFYSFSQTLMHKFLYEKMDAPRRRALHRKIATTIKELYGELIETNKEIKDKYNLHKQIGQGIISGINHQPESIKKVQDSKDNKDSLISAANAELSNATYNFKQFAVDECLDNINKALAFLSALNDSDKNINELKFKIYLTRFNAQYWKGLYKDAHKTAELLRKNAREQEKQELLAQANICLGKAHTSLGEKEKSFPYLYHAVEIYKNSNNQKMHIEALYQLARSKHAGAYYDDAIEHTNEALNIAESRNDEPKIADCLLQLGSSFSKKAEYSKAVELYHKALSIFERKQNKTQIGHVFNKIGLIYHSRAIFNKADGYFHKALKIAKEQNDLVNIANRTNNLAIVQEGLGNYDDAIEFYKKSLEIDRSLNDKPMITKSLNNIGNAYMAKGDSDSAMQYFNEAISIAETLEDKVELSYTYSSIGHAYDGLGDADKSIEYLNRAIEIDLKIGDMITAAANYVGLGNAYYSIQNYDKAKEYYHKSLGILQKADDKLGMATIRNNLGGIEYTLENYQSSIDYYTKALEYYKKVNDKISYSLTGGNLAKCFVEIGQKDKAKDLFVEVINIAEEVNEQVHLSRHYIAIAELYRGFEQFQTAVNYYQKAVDVNKQLNNWSDTIDNYRNIADIYADSGNYNESLDYLNLTIELYDNLTKSGTNISEDGYINTYQLMAWVYMQQENYSKSIELYNNVTNWYEKNNQMYNAIFYAYNLGLCYENIEDWQKAEKTYQRAIDLNKDVDKEQLAKANLRLANVWEQLNRLTDAFNAYVTSTKLYTELENNWQVADNKYNIARLYYNAEQYKEAINVLEDSAGLFYHLNDYYNLAYSYNLIGHSYYYQNKYDTALTYYKKAKETMLTYDPNSDIEFIDKQIRVLTSDDKPDQL